MSVAELQTQGITYDRSATELKVQGLLFKKLFSIRSFFRQVCLDHCQRELAQGRLCLLVEEDTCLTVWQSETLLTSIRKPIATTNPPQISQPPPQIQQSEDSSNQLEDSPVRAKHPTSREETTIPRYQRVYRGVPY